MKTLLNIILLLTCSITFCQTIKPLSSFYTDNLPTDSGEIISPVYYKDTNNYFTPFLGTWTAQLGSNTFVVTFWKETQHPYKDDNEGVLYFSDEIYGHYKLVQNYGTANETIIYTSQINYLNSSTPIKYIISTDSLFLNKMGGIIYDLNTMSNQKYRGTRGELEMIITGSNPTTATWKISDSEEINPGTFVIPKNLILTKL